MKLEEKSAKNETKFLKYGCERAYGRRVIKDTDAEIVGINTRRQHREVSRKGIKF